MNLTIYKSLQVVFRFLFYVIVLSLIIRVTPFDFPVKPLWVVLVAALLFGIDYSIVQRRELNAHCLRKNNMAEVIYELRNLGYQACQRDVDYIVFRRKGRLFEWQFAKLTFKQHYIELQLPDTEAPLFEKYSLDGDA